jgi:DNA-binding response OmpR family regulator
MAKILVVEDNPDISATIKTFLVFERHVADIIDNGADALNHLKTFPYDLIILDWELPGLSGVEVCKEFRNRRGLTPILMLTGKSLVSEKEIAFNFGADDYLTKPFDVRELGARIRALLRRPPQMVATAAAIEAGNLKVDLGKHEVTVNDVPIDLGPREFQLLEFLLSHPDQVFSPDDLLNRVWSAESEATTEALRTAMKRLRKKVDPEGTIIENVHGVGYILKSSKRV